MNKLMGSLTYRRSSFKESKKNLSVDLQKIAKAELKKIEKETYFDTSDSDCDFYLNSQQSIVERSADGTFGRFDELLGSGTFKRVYRGYDFNAGREIAWNIINVKSSDDNRLDKIKDEINILKQLDHPNIIHFIKGWLEKDNKHVVIITELVSGGSLRSNLKRIKEPRLRLVKKWIKDILSGLEYLHQKKIIHRDIKCDNIFLDNLHGNLKIGDLGGSEYLYNNYSTNYVGTEEFMAPEVHEGKYSVKADIYSLGMSIIEMLTLEKPYKECEGAMAIYYNITHDIFPESLYKINNENIVKLIKLCLKRENERPSASELLIDTFLNDTISEENNYPVKIINHLRQNNILNKSKRHALVDPNLKKTPQYKQEDIKVVYDPNQPYSSTSPLSSPSLSPKAIKKKNTQSSFVITIKETEVPINQPIDPEINNNQFVPGDFKKYHHSRSIKSNEIEINFIVRREKWKNKKLLKCSYSLNNDTVDGLASELQNAIDLNDEEYQIVKHKLNESRKYPLFNQVIVTHYTSNSNGSSHRNTLIPVSDDSKNKSRYEDFLSSFNVLSESIKDLLNDENTKQLRECSSDLQHKIRPEMIEMIEMIDKFKRKEKLLISILNHSNMSKMSECK